MRVFIPILILFLSTSLGCTIMDELDSANADMDEFVGIGAEEEEEVDSEGQRPTSASLAKEWWGKAKSLDKKALSPAIVNCRLQSGSQFMSRDECLNRGGQPGTA